MTTIKTNSDLVKSDPSPVPMTESHPQLSESASIIQMIERVALNPAVDLDKMERLLKMRSDIHAAEREQAFNVAMAQAQAEMRAVAVDTPNMQTKSKYASYYALDKAVRPIYTKYGFGLSFNTASDAPQDHIGIVCYVTCAGHTRQYRIDMPADGKGAKGGDVMTKTHAVMSASTYGQRNLLKLIFNIAIGGEDDDGNAAGNTEPISSEQVATIQSLIVEIAADIGRFCKYMKVERIEQIKSKNFDAAIAALEAKRAKT